MKIKYSEQGHDVDEFYKDEEVDMVNHPPHYKAGKIEVIDFLEDQEHLGYHRLQAMRYITRSPFKGTELEDLKKARWYLDRNISLLEVKHG
jgi:hypothetical protein